MSSIQPLSDHIQDLGRSIDKWNSWYIFLVADTVILAAFVFITQFVVIRKSKELAVLQGQDSQDKDVKIAAAHERAANLEKEAAALLKQLIEQGPRSHLLYGERRERLIAQLKPFSGQKAEIRFCNSSFNLYSVDNDTTSVAMLLKYILEQANWSVNPLVIDNCSGTGLSVSIHPIAPTSAHQAADALLSALLSLPLTVVGNKVFVEESPRPPQPRVLDHDNNGKEIGLNPLGHDTVVVRVLAHP
jgi:hypothetical protein